MKKVRGEGNNCCPLIVLDYVHDVWKLPSFTSRGRPEIFREPVFYPGNGRNRVFYHPSGGRFSWYKIMKGCDFRHLKLSLAPLQRWCSIFKDSSLEIWRWIHHYAWFSSHHLWRLLERWWCFFKGSSLEMVTWFLRRHLLRLLERWCNLLQRILSGDGKVVYKLSSLVRHLSNGNNLLI